MGGRGPLRCVAPLHQKPKKKNRRDKRSDQRTRGGESSQVSRRGLGAAALSCGGRFWRLRLRLHAAGGASPKTTAVIALISPLPTHPPTHARSRPPPPKKNPTGIAQIRRRAAVSFSVSGIAQQPPQQPPPLPAQHTGTGKKQGRCRTKRRHRRSLVIKGAFARYKRGFPARA